MTAPSAERVGRYQMLDPIGVGPTGAVSRAKVFGVAGFERQFAVKRVHAEITANGPMAQALSAAARAYGGLEHPRIARMSEFGVARGTTYTAVEYVVGLDAMKLVTEARLAGLTLAAGGALALVSQAARAIGYAHGRGLTHLGLAPTNVIVTAEGDLKITDFGILAATLPGGPVQAGHAGEHARFANRIPYLAPEQLAGEVVSAATDVFALGLLAYELIGGVAAYRGDSPQAIAQAILAGPPAELALPRPIARVIARCLARSPFERFPDARALADALDAAVRVAPVPGTRKDIGAHVASTLERLAALREGEMSGMLAFNIGTGPIPKEHATIAPSVATLGRNLGNAMPALAVDPSTPVPGPTPLVGPTRPPTGPGLAQSGLAGDASATQPELPRPQQTMPGLAPPPIPVPSLAMPPRVPASLGGQRDARPPGPPRMPTGQIPPIPSRASTGAIPPVSPRAGSVPPVRPGTDLAIPVEPDPTATLHDDAHVLAPRESRDLLTDEMSPIVMHGLPRATTRPTAEMLPRVEATFRQEAMSELSDEAHISLQPAAHDELDIQIYDSGDDSGDADDDATLTAPNELEHPHGLGPDAPSAAATHPGIGDAGPMRLPSAPGAPARPTTGPLRPSAPPPIPLPAVSVPSPITAFAPPSEASRGRLGMIVASICGAGALAAGAWFAYDRLKPVDAVIATEPAIVFRDAATAVATTPPDAAQVAVAPTDAVAVAATTPADARVVAAVVPDAAAPPTPDAAVVAAITPDAAVATPVPVGPPPSTGDALVIDSVPPGARVFLDGADVGVTPLKLAGAADKHSLAIFLPGHDLFLAQVDGVGTHSIPLVEVTPTGGHAGIKVLKCAPARYYVYVDGKPTGQTCPTERIDTVVGKHTVEVYDLVSESRRKWDILIPDERLSFRVKVE